MKEDLAMSMNEVVNFLKKSPKVEIVWVIFFGSAL